jgi:5-deoxy-D-glucuronate isomerase
VTQLHLRRGTTTEGAYELKVTPERAGWGSSGRRIPELEAGGAHPLESGEDELIVLPLRGGCAVIADGERFTVHGVSMAPGYDLYYVNVIAGTGDRAWRFRDDPDHGWIRGTWHEDEIDPRLPMIGPKGRDR